MFILPRKPAKATAMNLLRFFSEEGGWKKTN